MKRQRVAWMVSRTSIQLCEICVKIKVEKGTNGYADQNKMLVVLTPNSKDFISGGAAPISSQAPQPQSTASGPVPDWAR